MTIGINTSELSALEINAIQAIILQAKLFKPDITKKEINILFGISSAMISKETTALMMEGFLTQDGTVTQQYFDALDDPDSVVTNVDEVAARLKEFVNKITGSDQKLLGSEKRKVRDAMRSPAYRKRVNKWKRKGQNVLETSVHHFQTVALYAAYKMRDSKKEGWEEYSQITTFLRSVERYEENADRAANWYGTRTNPGQGMKAWVLFNEKGKFL